MENYADIVKLHYEYYKSNKKTPLRGSYKKHIPSNLKEIEKYSDIDSMVFENNNNNELVIAMRGLDFFGSPRDAMIGAEIGLEDAYQQSGSDFETSTKKKKGISLLPNMYGEILIKEQSKIDELKNEYPNKKIVLAGHSRGGRKVIDLGEHNQLEYHAFQPAEMNRMGNPLLSVATNMMMGGIPTDKISGVMWKTLYGPNRVVNNMMFEFGSPMKLQNNVLGAAIQTDGYQTFANKFLSKTLTPSIVERSIAMQGGENPFYEPVDFTRMPSNTFNVKSFNSIEPVVSVFAGQKQEKRTPKTESISNIYKTSNDLVSKGYQHTELVKPKQYVYNMFDHYLLGDHSIDHFISEEMFNSVNENREIIEDEIDNLEPTISPPPIIQPSSTIGYSVNNRELCKKYGSVYNVHCNKLLR